ncbi:DedA family protein [Oceanobacillus damuensis]|uniref:DedA family protein n=1 Tax=Oceanobacillus damuensis TaxID=937928 RepID=UPI00082DE599|nr:VTT domain-containing protein [Oceanobacillus damuensis]
MLETIINAISDLGILGLFASVAIEASSLPFPGGLLALMFGYLLNLTFIQLVLYGLMASIIYTVFSLIPFLIGLKMEERLKKMTSRKGIEKAQASFKRFGIWSVALSRVLGIGNYVSYVAGISKMRIWNFLLLTMIGITPWMIGMLWLGSIGNIESVQKIIGELQFYGILLIAIAIIGFVIYRKKVKPQNNSY